MKKETEDRIRYSGKADQFAEKLTDEQRKLLASTLLVRLSFARETARKVMTEYETIFDLAHIEVDDNFPAIAAEIMELTDCRNALDIIIAKLQEVTEDEQTISD